MTTKKERFLPLLVAIAAILTFLTLFLLERGGERSREMETLLSKRDLVEAYICRAFTEAAADLIAGATPTAGDVPAAGNAFVAGNAPDGSFLRELVAIDISTLEVWPKEAKARILYSTSCLPGR